MELRRSTCPPRWLAMIAGLAVCGAAFGGTYPDKPITLVVPYGPGGNADLAARALSATLQTEKLLPQSVVVVNRAGAGGIIGTQYVQRGKPDGYTLLMARVGSQVVAPALNPVTPYKWSALTPISLLETDPYVCVVRANSPLKTFKQLLAEIKASPGKLSYATTSSMDASVVFPVKAFLDAGLSAKAATMVPYKGAGATITAVMAGTVDFTCNALAPYLGGLRAGTLRALVVSTPHRLAEFPHTPTVAQLGMKNLEMVSGWNALYGPPGLPKQVIQYWTKVLSRLKGTPAWAEQCKRRGTSPKFYGPKKTYAFVKEQYHAYHALSKYIGPNR